MRSNDTRWTARLFLAATVALAVGLLAAAIVLSRESGPSGNSQGADLDRLVGAQPPHAVNPRRLTCERIRWIAIRGAYR